MKTYPPSIILSHDIGAATPVAYVVGISDKAPTEDERAIEVPRKLARYLGLDEEPCWAYTDQLNVFSWPGPDLRPADRLSSRPSAADTCIIGQLPTDWFEQLKADVLRSRDIGLLKAQKRTE